MKKFFLIFSLITLIFTLSVPCYANEGDISAISNDIPEDVIQKAKDLNVDVLIIYSFGDSWLVTYLKGWSTDFLITDISVDYSNLLLPLSVSFEGSAEEGSYSYDINSNRFINEGFVDSSFVFEPYCYDVNGEQTPYSSFKIFVNNEEYLPEGVEPDLPDEDLSFEDNVISLLQKNNEILSHVYTAQLFAIAVVTVVGVVFLLYKFLKSFY